MLFLVKILFPFCTKTWCVSNYATRQRNGLERGNEIIKQTIVMADTELKISHFVCSLQLF